jgi:hypothetical protein
MFAPGQGGLEGILAFEAAAFRMKEVAEEEIQRAASIARGHLELAGGALAGQGPDRRGKWRVPIGRLHG